MKSSHSSLDHFSFEGVDSSAKRQERKSSLARERARLRARQDEEEQKKVPPRNLQTIEEESRQSSDCERRSPTVSMGNPKRLKPRFESRRDFVIANMRLQAIKEDDNEGFSKSESALL